MPEPNPAPPPSPARLVPAAAPRPQRVRAQARFELRLMLRNGENLLATLIIPVGMLVFFSLVPVLPTDGSDAVAFLVPGVLALSVVAAGVLALGISTGFERSYLVLKRLGATPLSRGELVVAKVGAVVGIQVAQVAVIVLTGLALGWRPALGLAHAALAATAWLLGVSACCGIGLGLAGRLPAMATLATTNALFLVLLLCSGIVFPLAALPGPAAAVAQLLPSAALTSVLRVALGGGPLDGALAVPVLILTAWAAAAPAVASSVFRWE